MELAIDAAKYSDDAFWEIAITLASNVAWNRYRAAEEARYSLTQAGVDLDPSELSSNRHFDHTALDGQDVCGYRLPGSLFACVDGKVLFEPDPDTEAAEVHSNWALKRTITSLSPNDKQYLIDELVVKAALLA